MYREKGNGKEKSGERLASVHGFDEVFASALKFLHCGGSTVKIDREEKRGFKGSEGTILPCLMFSFLLALFLAFVFAAAVARRSM